MKARCLFELGHFEDAIAEAKRGRAMTREYEFARTRLTNLINASEKAIMDQPVIE